MTNTPNSQNPFIEPLAPVSYRIPKGRVLEVHPSAPDTISGYHGTTLDSGLGIIDNGFNTNRSSVGKVFFATNLMSYGNPLRFVLEHAAIVAEERKDEVFATQGLLAVVKAEMPGVLANSEGFARVPESEIYRICISGIGFFTRAGLAMQPPDRFSDMIADEEGFYIRESSE